jgi:hypothetical protein
MFNSRHRGRRIWLALVGASVATTLMVGGAAAHSHKVNEGTDQERLIANGQNHPAFVFDAVTGKWVSCTTNTLLPGYGPAWYGLETAHHGPDSLAPGKGDGCYAADANPAPSIDGDDANPAID